MIIDIHAHPVLLDVINEAQKTLVFVNSSLEYLSQDAILLSLKRF